MEILVVRQRLAVLSLFHSQELFIKVVRLAPDKILILSQPRVIRSLPEERGTVHRYSLAVDLTTERQTLPEVRFMAVEREEV
jgi:hypothetical protein